MPAWQGPDEVIHFGYIQFIAEQKKIPQYHMPWKNYSNDVSKELRHSMTRMDIAHIAFKPANIQRFTYDKNFIDAFDSPVPELPRNVDPRNYRNNALSYSPVFYLYGTAFYLLAYNSSIENRMYMVRFGVSLLMVPLVIYSFLFGRLLFGDDIIALALAAFVSFQPMVSFVYTIVNNDALLITSAAAAFYHMTSFYFTGGRDNAIKTGFWLSVAALSKSHGLGIMALAPIFLTARYFRSGNLPWRYIASSIAILALLTLPWYLFSYYEYESFLGPGFRSLDITAAKYEAPALFDRFNPLFFRWPFTMFVSFWGNFGHLDTPIPHSLSLVLWGIYIVAFAAVAALAIKIVTRREFGNRSNIIFLSLVSAVYLFDLALSFSVYQSLMYEGGHGRYYFPVWLPMASILFYTLVSLSPERYARMAAVTASLLMFSYFIYTLLSVVTARYYL